MTKRGRKKNTIWNLFFNYIAILISVVNSIVLVPLYLKFIPSDLYGAWLATGSILTWISAIDPGLSTILQQQIALAYGKRDTEKIIVLLNGGLLITFIIAVLIFFVGFTVALHLPNWLRLPDGLDYSIIVTAFRIASIGVALSILSFSIRSISQGMQVSISVGVVYVVVYITGIIFTVILLQKGFGILSIANTLLYQSVGTILGYSLCLIMCLREEKINWSPRFIGLFSLLQLMSYTFLARAGSVISSNIDAFVVARYIGVQAVPAITFTKKIPAMSRPFLERPAYAFMPSISSLLGENQIHKAQQVLVRLLFYILWGSSLFCTGFLIFNRIFIDLWIGSEFFAGSLVNLIICIDLAIAVISSSLGNLCFAMGNIKGNSIILLAQSMIYIPLSILGAVYFGLIGVVSASIVATLLTSFWYFILVFNKKLNVPSYLKLSLLKELSLMILLSLLIFQISFLVSTKIDVASWKDFTCQIIVYVIAFSLLLYILSSNFRQEITSMTVLIRERSRSPK